MSTTELGPYKDELVESPEILRDICFQYAAQIKTILLERHHNRTAYDTAGRLGRLLLRRSVKPVNHGTDFFYATVETPPFTATGNQAVGGESAVAWVVKLRGRAPNGVVFSGKKPPGHAFVDFNRSPLILEQVGVNEDGGIERDHLTFREIDIANATIHGAEDLEETAELRVLLEACLKSLKSQGQKPPSSKELDKVLPSVSEVMSIGHSVRLTGESRKILLERAQRARDRFVAEDRAKKAEQIIS